MRWASPTPGSTSISRMSNSWRAPTAPSTVCRAPVERWTSNPMPIRRSITCWICSSVACSCIATIIGFSEIPNPRSLRVRDPYPLLNLKILFSLYRLSPKVSCHNRAPSSSQRTLSVGISGRKSVVHFHVEFSMLVAGFSFRRNLIFLNVAHYVDDPLIYRAQFAVGKRPAIDAQYILKNPLLALRLIDGHAGVPFQLADFMRGLGAFIQQLNQAAVKLINFVAPVGNLHSLGVLIYSH